MAACVAAMQPSVDGLRRERGVLTRRIRDAVKSHRRGEAEGDIARSKEVAKEIAKEAEALLAKDADDAVGSLVGIPRLMVAQGDDEKRARSEAAWHAMQAHRASSSSSSAAAATASNDCGKNAGTTTPSSKSCGDEKAKAGKEALSHLDTCCRAVLFFKSHGYMPVTTSSPVPAKGGNESGGYAFRELLVRCSCRTGMVIF